jgi:CHAT domain-containing protein
LNFQSSKFHLSDSYLKDHGVLLLRAARHHLEDLHRMLMAPLEKWIDGRSLVIIPHHALHYVPFQALYDGSEYLLDKHDVVYSSSASVLKICRAKVPTETEMDLVLAVPDPSTPAIADEAEMLRELLPNARVFV